MEPELLEYHKGCFTCAENDFPIAAAAIEFEDQNIAWVGNTWFIPHAFKHFGARKINIHVAMGLALEIRMLNSYLRT